RARQRTSPVEGEVPGRPPAVGGRARLGTSLLVHELLDGARRDLAVAECHPDAADGDRGWDRCLASLHAADGARRYTGRISRSLAESSLRSRGADSCVHESLGERYGGTT